MEDPLNCPICFDRFTEPIILKCGHTFDKCCIEEEELCPICRTEVEAWTTNWQVIHILEHFPVTEMIPLDDPKYLSLSDPMHHYHTVSWTELQKGQKIGYNLTFMREKKIFYGTVHYIDVCKNQLEIQLANRKIVTVCPDFINEIWYHPGFADTQSDCDVCVVI